MTVVRTAGRRIARASLVVVLATGACGGSTTDDTTPTSTASAAPEPSGSGATRQVESLAGPLVVPADPQRVVVLDAARVAGTLLDLGVPVVGLTEVRPDTLTAEESAALPDVGLVTSPNYEAITELAPDLIIASSGDASIIDLLSEIAPTFPTELTSDWRDDVRRIADIVNRTAESEALLDDFDARVAAVSALVEAEAAGSEAVLVRVRQDRVRAHTNLHFAGNLLAEVGLATPAGFIRERTGDLQVDGRNRVVDLSPERLGDLADADLIFMTVRGTRGDDAGAEAARDELLANQIFRQLPAVEQGRLVQVGAHWVFGGLREAELVLDDIEAALGG